MHLPTVPSFVHYLFWLLRFDICGYWHAGSCGCCLPVLFGSRYAAGYLRSCGWIRLVCVTGVYAFVATTRYRILPGFNAAFSSPHTLPRSAARYRLRTARYAHGYLYPRYCYPTFPICYHLPSLPVPLIDPLPVPLPMTQIYILPCLLRCCRLRTYSSRVATTYLRFTPGLHIPTLQRYCPRLRYTLRLLCSCRFVTLFTTTFAYTGYCYYHVRLFTAL